MKRRFLKIRLIPLLVSVTALFLSGCSGNAAEEAGKIRIISTIFAPYDFARQIAGDKAVITMLLPPAAESHSFEPTAKDMIEIQNCDLFLYIGGESEDWIEKILSAAGGGQSLRLIESVTVVEEEFTEGMEIHEHEEDNEPEYDEHIWTSPLNAVKMVGAISGALCGIDPQNADYYKANADEYINKLYQLDADFKAVVNSAARNVLVFGDRFPFRYFTDEYGLEYFAAFPGCSSETEPSAKTIAFLIDKIRDENIPAVLYAEMSNGKVAGTIAESAGAETLLLHSCHNVSRDEFQSGVTYYDLMKGNVDILRTALG